MKRFMKHVLFVALAMPVAAHGFIYMPNTFYYTNPFSEPRYPRSGITSVELQLSGGFANNGRNGSKNKVNVLEIYGNYDIAELGIGAISNPASGFYNALLADLYASGIDESGTGTLSYSGKFTEFDGKLYIGQNIAKGFYVDLIVPFKRLQIKDVAFTDLSTGPDAESVTWLAVRNNLTNILAQYDVDASGYKKTGVGDILLGLGWSYSKLDSDVIDFFDTTLKFNISVPSASKKDEDNAFAIPLGYDGHVAFPIYFDMSMGFFDWFTFGAHVDGVFFVSKSKVMRLNTNPNQTGMFKLLKGEAKRSMGPQVDVTAYAKADHVFEKFSLYLGYNFMYKGHDTLTPVNLNEFNSAIVNVDPMLKSLYSHSILTGLDCDFTEEGRKFNPHIGVFYTIPVAGKRIYQTNNIGGTVGVHVRWDF